MKRLAVGILAHVDAGKTTLSEAMLYAGGMIRHLGRVDKGDAFLDTYELEKKRGITIFSKQARLAWDDMDVTLLDTPGHVDFSAEMERVLQVLDYAVLVISGSDGGEDGCFVNQKCMGSYIHGTTDTPGTGRVSPMCISYPWQVSAFSRK